MSNLNSSRSKTNSSRSNNESNNTIHKNTYKASSSTDGVLSDDGNEIITTLRSGIGSTGSVNSIHISSRMYNGNRQSRASMPPSMSSMSSTRMSASSVVSTSNYSHGHNIIHSHAIDMMCDLNDNKDDDCDHHHDDASYNHYDIGNHIHDIYHDDDNNNNHDDDDDFDDRISLYVNAKTENNDFFDNDSYDDASTIVTTHQKQQHFGGNVSGKGKQCRNESLHMISNTNCKHSVGSGINSGGGYIGGIRVHGQSIIGGTTTGCGGGSGSGGGGGGGGGGRVNVFRRLSKSASRFLSQDRQTLSELLNVHDNQKEQILTQLQPQSPQEQLNSSFHDIVHLCKTTQQNRKIHNINIHNTSNNNSNYNNKISTTPSLILKDKSHQNVSLHETISRIQSECQTKLKEQEQRLTQKYESKINILQEEIQRLNTQLNGKKKNNKNEIDINNKKYDKKNKDEKNDDNNVIIEQNNMNHECNHDVVTDLTTDQISRYSRQLLLKDGFGVIGQQKLLSSSVLVIGAGGIGSTVLLYLAASGIGQITIIDFDSVEKSNLHRQIIHCEENVGMNKALSASIAIKRLNPSIICNPIQDMFTYDNAMDIIAKYKCDCVVDACDNPQTRYISNDVCIMNKIPLISGSAMGTEGQLSVYGYKDSGCYRCLYPKVNPIEGCKSCSDNGVLGPVPGLIGILQATETIKVLTGVGSTMHDRLLMYDSMRCTFMSIKKPPRRKDCIVCSDQAKCSIDDCKHHALSARGPQSTKCEITESSTITAPERNISCREYQQLRSNEIPHILLDVRVKRQFDICSLSGAVNLELGNIENNLDTIEEMSKDGKPVFCICRRGIASAEATLLLSEKSKVNVYNIVGGYNAWKKEVDISFPTY